MLHKNVVNIYIVYEITSDYKDINYPKLENCLFGSIELTKNADIGKYRYFGYGIGFDRQSSFSIGNETGKNVTIFGVDMSSSTKIDNRKKDILILGNGTMEWNGRNSYLFVNGKEIIKFKAKDSEIVPYSLCLENSSKDWTNDNMKNTGFNGYIYDFSTDYNTINKSKILDIHKYLMKKIIIWCK